MSEYQYYEFQAIDRPLTEREMRELRSSSTRATITPRRFVNHYDFGDLKADPMEWVEKYFDAFLYLANWGNRTLALRLPSGLVSADVVAAYCPGGAANLTNTGTVTILEFCSDSEADDCDDWGEFDDDAVWLASLVPLRADIASGDYRALYLGWLLCVQQGDLNADVPEPPVPPGLKQPTEALQALVHFLRIDPDLLGVAALASRDESVKPTWRALAQCIGGLPETEKTDLLVRLAMGEEPHLRAALPQRRSAERVRGTKSAYRA